MWSEWPLVGRIYSLSVRWVIKSCFPGARHWACSSTAIVKPFKNLSHLQEECSYVFWIKYIWRGDLPFDRCALTEDCTLPHVFRRILPDSSGFQRTLPDSNLGMCWYDKGQIGMFSPAESIGIWWIPAESMEFHHTIPLSKGALALESRTEGWLVSPTTAAEKKLYPHQDLALNLGLSIVEHARVCRHVVYILEHVEMIYWAKKKFLNWKPWLKLKLRVSWSISSYLQNQWTFIRNLPAHIMDTSGGREVCHESW